MKCGSCNACEIEKVGCGCDGATDDGCFLCAPERHQRPECPPAAVQVNRDRSRCIHGFRLTEPCTKC